MFRKILAHREDDDGNLQFQLDWEGDYAPTWEPRANVPEESVSRYLAKQARRARRAAQRK